MKTDWHSKFWQGDERYRLALAALAELEKEYRDYGSVDFLGDGVADSIRHLIDQIENDELVTDKD